jgi:MFS family permease
VVAVKTEDRAAGRRTRLLRDTGGFRALWLSRSVSFTGDGIGRTALVLTTARDGPAAVSLVLLASTLPRFLGPLAGALADRVEQRRLMAVCELGQAAAFGLVAVLLPPLPLLLPLVAAASVFATAFLPAGRSAVPALVPAQHLGRANAMLGTAFNLQVAVGPALGGLTVGLGGSRPAFALDAAMFVLSAALLTRLPKLPPQPGAGDAAGLWVTTLDGLRYAAQAPVPRAVIISVLLVVSFAGIDNVALVFLVEGDLGGSATGYGLVLACFGLGMLAVSLGLGLLRSPLSAGLLLVGGTTATATGTALTALAPTVAVAALTQALAGAGNGSENIAGDTLVQRLVPRHLLGRVFGATSTAAQVGAAVAYLVAGPLLTVIDPRVAFLVAGLGSASALLVLLPALRTLSHPPPP